MADREPVGYYDPQTAERIWRAVQSWERYSAVSRKGLRPPANTPQPNPILAKNDSGEEIPRFACVQATGTSNEDGQTYLLVNKPQDTTAESGPFYLNTVAPIPASATPSLAEFPYGVVTSGPTANAWVDSNYSAGTELEPVVGEWYLTEKTGSKSWWRFIGDNSTFSGQTGNNICKVKFEEASAGGGDVIIFELGGDAYAGEAYSAHCDDQLEDAASSYSATVLWKGCGASIGIGDAVTVYDELGSFLSGREAADIAGKTGVAHYMEGDTEYETGCKWIITWIDWFREVQMLEDLIVGADELRFKVKRISVWDDCDLDDIVIPLTDCEEYGE